MAACLGVDVSVALGVYVTLTTLGDIVLGDASVDSMLSNGSDNHGNSMTAVKSFIISVPI